MAEQTSTQDVAAEQPAPQPAPSTGRRRRDGTSPAPGGAAKSHKKKAADKPQLTPEMIEAATAGWERVITLGVFAVQSFVAPPYPPTAEEGENITKPLARILGRHYPIPEITGDAEDAFALVIAASMYGARVFADLQQMKTPPLPPAEPEPPRAAHTRHAAAAQSPAPSPTSEAVPNGSHLRAPMPGEGTGVPPDELVGPPDEVLARLHEASYREEAATA